MHGPRTLIYSVDEKWVITRKAFRAANTGNEEDAPGWTDAVFAQLDAFGWAALDAGNCQVSIFLAVGRGRLPIADSTIGSSLRIKKAPGRRS